MVTAEWDIPFTLLSPHGELDLNTDGTVAPSPRLETTYRYLVNPKGSACGPDLRLERLNVPQGDGEIARARFKTGYPMQLALEFWVGPALNAEPACGADLRRMIDELMLHVNALVRQDGSGDSQRVRWTPSATATITPDDRMLDNCLLLSWPTQEHDDDGMVTVTFAVVSPFPYAIDATELDTNLSDGVPATIANDGTAAFFPTFRVQGATSSFQIQNTTSGEVFVYDAALPGASSIAGGHYVEIDMFRETAYLDGSGASRKSGIDILNSDPISLLPGDNVVEIVGADALVMSNNAWA